jgi:hypothetical protein
MNIEIIIPKAFTYYLSSQSLIRSDSFDMADHLCTWKYPIPQTINQKINFPVANLYEVHYSASTPKEKNL